MNIEQIARVAHEINRAYCLSIGDYSQRPWDEAPEWQKESAINGVKFNLENPMATPEQSHENWRQEKIDAGWVWGSVKDETVKQHPCMVPYPYLPQRQKSKDFLFKSIVTMLSPQLTEF